MQPELSIKQSILEMLKRLPDDIGYDRAIEGIYVLQRVEIAREEVRRGEVYDDGEVMQELLADHATQAHMGALGSAKADLAGIKAYIA